MLLSRTINYGLWFSSGQVGFGGRLEGCGLACECGVAASSVSDPYSFFTDPDPDPEVEAGDQYGSGSGSNPDPIRIQGFNDQKF